MQKIEPITKILYQNKLQTKEIFLTIKQNLQKCFLFRTELSVKKSTRTLKFYNNPKRTKEPSIMFNDQKFLMRLFNMYSFNIHILTFF